MLYDNLLALKSTLSCTVTNGAVDGSRASHQGGRFMQKRISSFIIVLWLTSATILAQTGRPAGQQVLGTNYAAPLDTEREQGALQALLKITEKEIIVAVDAMPADKFGFAPTDGEFKGVRAFGQSYRSHRPDERAGECLTDLTP